MKICSQQSTCQFCTFFKMRSFIYFSTILGTAMAAGCPYMSGELPTRGEDLEKRQAVGSLEGTTISTQEFLAPFELNDTNVYMTTDSGTPIDDAVSLKAGIRGPTLLEDFIFRQKLQRFDHERVSIHLLPTLTRCIRFDLAHVS